MMDFDEDIKFIDCDEQQHPTMTIATNEERRKKNTASTYSNKLSSISNRMVIESGTKTCSHCLTRNNVAASIVVPTNQNNITSNVNINNKNRIRPKSTIICLENSTTTNYNHNNNNNKNDSKINLMFNREQSIKDSNNTLFGKYNTYMPNLSLIHI